MYRFKLLGISYEDFLDLVRYLSYDGCKIKYDEDSYTIFVPENFLFEVGLVIKEWKLKYKLDKLI